MTSPKTFEIYSSLLMLLIATAPLASEAQTAASTESAPSKYFVIQNIATEKTRVYERCTETPSCPHRLVMETDMVVGRPEEGTEKDPHAFKTWLGHAKITAWMKFYQDGKGHYPHWYKEGQDLATIPAPMSEGISKITAARNWMVQNERGEKTIYGAFGWYAAILAPADDINGINHQWIHGTIGWGKDGPASIEFTRSAFLNLVSNPGSSGCTRLENRAVAYLRSFLTTGTDVYRIYARESTREQEGTTGVFRKKITPLPRYADKFNNPLQWDYILLTNGAQKWGGLTADANTIRSKRIAIIPGQNLIEEGFYLVDQYPNAVQPNYTFFAASGLSGDRYQLDDGKQNQVSKFQGYFLVDEGRLIDYKHPDTSESEKKIKVGGLPDFKDSVPEVLTTTGEHFPPAIKYIEEQTTVGG